MKNDPLPTACSQHREAHGISSPQGPGAWIFSRLSGIVRHPVEKQVQSGNGSKSIHPSFHTSIHPPCADVQMRKHGNKRTTDSEVEIKKIQMNQLQQIQSYTYTRNNDDGSHSEGALEVGRRGGEAQAWAGGGPRGGRPPPPWTRSTRSRSPMETPTSTR